MVSDPVVQANINRLIERHERGMLTYGITMADNPLKISEWLDHAIEEALDLANYLQRIKDELNRKP